GDSPLGMGWPNVPDAVRRFDVMLDVIRDRSQPVTLLDWGCGTGHLLEHIRNQNDVSIDYSGIDLSERFIGLARDKFPESDFRVCDILKDSAGLSTWDYAVINGVFTSKCSMSFDDMLEFVRRVISLLFRHVRIGLAFNTMSKHVDWERDDLFHLPLDTIAQILCTDLSRHFVIRNDYGLYEHTIYVYHQPRTMPSGR
ncbi:MAG: class I SAM-dependent methyltransferase, partial [Planctomycetaceae bacterium]|nr:class I SAM-dependent methyltransferase [Planctomycetaceae bacterium]